MSFRDGFICYFLIFEHKGEGKSCLNFFFLISTQIVKTDILRAQGELYFIFKKCSGNHDDNDITHISTLH